MTNVPPPPKVNLCQSCAHLMLDEYKEWYCVSKASRDITINCCSLKIMYEHKICGPAVKWRHFEQKR